MTYNKINTNNEISDIDFEQIQEALEKFRNPDSATEKNNKRLLKYPDRFKELIASGDYEQLGYLAECFMCTLRDVLANVKKQTEKEIAVKCADSMGITVQKKDNILEVTLPMIIPTKAKAKSEYLFEPLFFAMENFASSESLFIKEKAMMYIEYIYDKSNKNISRGDHDNKEVKQVIDAIAAFVVPDDSDKYLSLCQISTEGEYNHTKVYVMPERCFGDFFLDHSKSV